MTVPTIFRSRVNGNLVINVTAHPLLYRVLNRLWRLTGGWTMRARVGVNMVDFVEFRRD